MLPKSSSARAFARLMILVALSAALRPNAAAAEFTLIAGWDRHLFPAYIVATATTRPTPEEQAAAARESLLGDPNGLLGVVVYVPADNASVKVTIASDSILEPMHTRRRCRRRACGTRSIRP